MTVSALFGVKASTLEGARALAERTLGVVLEERESSDRGGVYLKFRGQALQAVFLQENIEVPENEPAEVDFPQYQYLLYVSGISEDSEFLLALENAPQWFERLRTRVS